MNPPQIVSELKANQRRRKGLLKGTVKPTLGIEDELQIMREMDNTNIRLIGYLMPKLKAVDLNVGNQDEEGIVVTIRREY